MTAPSRSPLDLAAITRDASVADWSLVSRRAPLLCLPVIAAWICFGLLTGRHPSAALAVAGAVTVAFGAFQRLPGSHLRTMLFTLLGISLHTFAGCLAGYLGPIPFILTATLSGYLFGAITFLGFSAWWVGMQWTIALLVYGAHPAGPADAARNGLIVLIGGLSQLLFLTAFRPFTAHWFRPSDKPALDTSTPLGTALLQNLNPASTPGRYALRVATAMLLGTIAHYASNIANGYWAPMTAAILLKPDLHETAVRGLGRLAGTLIGAGLTTLFLAHLHPDSFQRGLLILLIIWASFAFQRVNYTLFAVFITSYVVLLLAAMGLPDTTVALHRIEATLAGAAIALLVHLIPLPHAQAAAQPAP